jgi:plasmid stability protein
MTLIELPDDLAAALKARAAAQHLKLEDWFRMLADVPAGNGNDLDRIFAEIRGLADDIDFSRDAATSRPVDL